MPLLDAPENAARQLALHLLDLARDLDPRLRREIFTRTYAAKPDWRDAAAPILDAPPAFTLLRAEARVLLPEMDNGRPQFLTVSAEAVPARGQRGLKVGLPEQLRNELKDKSRAPLRAEVDQRMTALRAALRLRHEVSPEGWTVGISVARADKVPVPQLFAGMAAVLEALLSGENLAPHCLLAAGADVSGKLHTVVPVEDLLPALSPEERQIIILPAGAGEQLDDWIFLHPDRWPLLYQFTLHRAPDVSDAAALMKARRAPLLQQAMDSYEEAAARLRAATDPLAELRSDKTVAQLRQVVASDPQHLSAAALLKVAAGGSPTLSINGSLQHIDRLAGPVLSTDRNRFPLHIPRPQFEKSVFGKAGDTLVAARHRLHPAVRAYAAEVVTLARMLDRAAGTWRAYLNKNGPPDPPPIRDQRARAVELRATLQPVP
jgi:hypothetical protein